MWTLKKFSVASTACSLRASGRPSGPSLGDIGEPLKHIELEPLEVPSVVPQTVPAQEPVPA